MNRFGRFAAFSTLSVALVAGSAIARAQDNDHHDQAADHHDQAQAADRHDAYVKHEEWKKGYHMKQDDWGRAQHVDDWKTHHLREPPHGYEWRQVDGNYVLADVNTGIVNTVVAVPLPR